MSRDRSSTAPRTPTKRDRGVTLPELLIVVSIMGLLAAVLGATLTVTLRQADNTAGRTNVARSETAIDTWLPTDLASTDVNDTALPAVDDRADAEPCTTTCNGIDLSGTNALQLAWKTTIPGAAGGPPQTIVTRVQYQYYNAGGEWQIRRIECIGGSPCTVIVILSDVSPPANPATFDPDNDKPVWVMDVSVPDNPESLDLADNARKIVVTIDGGGDLDGSGGGANSISLTAGGRVTEEIDADQFTVPSFVRANSRCGGPITLLVDESGSISGGDMDNVIIPGVLAFIDAFKGTPTQLQVMKFSGIGVPLGPNNVRTSSNGGWHRYIDMTNELDVSALETAVQNDLNPAGTTNWESAFFQTFRETDGSVADTIPNRVVFFTDGVPTSGRHTVQESRGYSTRAGSPVDFNAGRYDNSVGWPNPDVGNYGIRYDQESWDRSDALLDVHRNVDLIFVGVGGGLNSNRTWIHNPTVYQDPSAPPAAGQSKQGSELLSYLLANGPSGHVTATSTTDGSGNVTYTNPEVADFYLQSSFDAAAFGAAMKATAMKDCGGTLTIQTRNADTNAPIDAEFRFENPTYRNDAGTLIEAQARTVTTSANFRTGTFDFDLSDSSEFFDVDIFPAQFQTNENYDFVGWSCRSGADDRIPTIRDIDGSTFKGFTVRVATNEAVSCIMTVRPK